MRLSTTGRANRQRSGFTQHFGCYRRGCTSVFACIRRFVAIVVSLRGPVSQSVSGNLSHVDPLCSLFDLFQAEKCALPCPGTGITDLFPGGLAFEVRIPEWPGPTLDRPGLVDRTISGLRVEKRAVAVRKLRQRNAPPDDSSMKQADFSDRLIKILRDLEQFIIGHPDDSWSTCTAVTALSACELQPVFEPWACRLT